VGTVAEVKPGNPFKQIRVHPAANLDRLEEVLVLLTLRPLELQKPAEAATDAGEKPPSVEARVPKP
jgi:cell shape-determining protein MreC